MSTHTEQKITDNNFVLEQDKRLSESLIWEIQKKYFEKQGIEAWNSGEVPHYITSNPFIADAYGRLVLAALRDWAASAVQATTNDQQFEESETIYIVELGAGPGRFGFHFLKEFCSLLSRSELSHLSFTYVMTDFSQSNIDFWRKHQSFQSFIEQGILDFALLDTTVENDEIRLIHSGKILTAGAIKNPVVVIANYFFDCIPQDVFYLHNGQLHEGRVSVTSGQEETDLSDPSVLSRIQLVYKHSPITSDLYDDPAFNKVLKDYEQKLSNATILFPVAAMKTIRFFLRFSNNRMILISADKGFHWEDEVFSNGEPAMAIHGGCFSMNLNFHALGQYMINRGGTLLQSAHHHSSLDVTAFLIGSPAISFSETQHAFEETIERVSPDDLFRLMQSAENSFGQMTPEQLLTWLKLAKWDGYLLIRLFPTLMNFLPAPERAFKEQLIWIIRHAWDNYYEINDGQNLAFCAGTLLCAMELFAEAIKYLEHSLQYSGPDARAYYNLALCYEALQKPEEALALAAKALDADGTCDPAKEMTLRLAAQLNRLALRS